MNNHLIKLTMILIIAITTALTASATERYIADFEQPTFQPGVLAGETYWSGQDGWVATGDLDEEPNFSEITVQSSIVRDGIQAAEICATDQASDFINVWRNFLFDPLEENEPYVYVDLDFYITDNAAPSEVWGMGIQSSAMGGVTKWLVWNDNSITILDPATGDWFDTGYDITRNTWHHMQTFIDFNVMTVQLIYDGQLIATVGAWDDLQLYAFASIYLGAPGSDTLYFDNYQIRSFSTTGIEDKIDLKPVAVTLNQNYPNPFNACTKINFDLTGDEYVRLDIFDILGRKVATLVDGFMSAGQHSILWDASAKPSGIYYYALCVGQRTVAKRMSLIK
jgi:hypothetical protein